MDQVDVDFSSKMATVTLKEGQLNKDLVQKAFEGTRYNVSSFEEIKIPKRAYTINITGMT